MAATPEVFVAEIAHHASKCRSHLARAKLALVLVKAATASGEAARHVELVERALGAGGDLERRVAEALTRSLFLDLKANFEFFLWTCCRAWLRHDFQGAVRRVVDAPELRAWVKERRLSDAFSDDPATTFLPPQGLEKLVDLLSAMSAARIDVGPHWPQVQVAFDVRHIIEHRNGRADDAFAKKVHEQWATSSWGRRARESGSSAVPRDGDVIEVTEADFDQTYEAMYAVVVSIEVALRAGWGRRAES